MSFSTMSDKNNPAVMRFVKAKAITTRKPLLEKKLIEVSPKFIWERRIILTSVRRKRPALRRFSLICFYIRGNTRAGSAVYIIENSLEEIQSQRKFKGIPIRFVEIVEKWKTAGLISYSHFGCEIYRKDIFY